MMSHNEEREEAAGRRRNNSEDEKDAEARTAYSQLKETQPRTEQDYLKWDEHLSPGRPDNGGTSTTQTRA